MTKFGILIGIGSGTINWIAGTFLWGASPVGAVMTWKESSWWQNASINIP